MERMDNVIDSLQAAMSRHPAMQKRIEEGSDPRSYVAERGNMTKHSKTQGVSSSKCFSRVPV